MKRHVLVITLFVAIFGFYLVTPVSANDYMFINDTPPFESPFGTVSINATVIGSSGSLPIYQGSFGENGSIDIQLEQFGKKRTNVTPRQEAPTVAKKIMESYGGLPADAVLYGVSTSYTEEFDHDLNTVVSKEPTFTTITYSRDINGLWIVGDSNRLILTLGENGELLWIFKVWRDYTYTGDVRIIPITTAFEKLGHGGVLTGPMVTDEKINIDSASPGYYSNTLANNDSELEPIWMLFGNTESGSRVGFYIYARQFANFTATPTKASIGDTITFTDTSDASPIKWSWDFGDGTNSPLQNPTHAYKTDGNYTVNLTAWNDLGSDTISRTEYITVYPDPKPAAAFISNYSWYDRIPPLTVVFNDTSAGTITNWSWDFGDGTNSTEQNATHVFSLLPHTIRRDLTVDLTVTDQFGRSSRYEEYVSIYKGLNPNFSAEPISGPSPLNVSFTDLTEDKDLAMSMGWNFGDGDYQSLWEYPSTYYHEYTQEGIYNVTLNYWGPYEDRFSTTKEFYITVRNISAPPVTDFGANTTSGKVPLSVAFLDKSVGSPIGWAWTFGDGLSSTEKNPVHTYSVPGIYTVALNATNAYGSNTITKTDYITVTSQGLPVPEFPFIGHSVMSVGQPVSAACLPEHQ
jgi:PKD repeat protein